MTTKMKFNVTLTFDVDVEDESGVYKEITDLLANKGLLKTIKESELPRNIYYGVREHEVPHKGAVPTQDEIKSKSKAIAKAFHNFVQKFFEDKELTYNIFVTVSLRETSASYRSQ
ncbi:hypothetical protein [Enterobacter roggenkampii]|uniref:hypothetical protein n=1 Tax=Enterobacter roggenkampii TaxID=1812935 RepID=UPI00107EA965|nr:hypothetical protein [Enterobacter roggenkampii]QBX86425.1 hypothetical protein E4005_17780 [Enterobacter roggenkampii]UWI98745.1 hypothetical protein N0B38_08835 [Enterobacter roggenkampii]